MRARACLPLLAVLLVTGCGKDQDWDGSLETLLASQPERFGTILGNPERYRVQIIYTQIDRDADNRPTFRSYTYRLDPDDGSVIWEWYERQAPVHLDFSRNLIQVLFQKEMKVLKFISL